MTGVQPFRLRKAAWCAMGLAVVGLIAVACAPGASDQTADARARSAAWNPGTDSSLPSSLQGRVPPEPYAVPSTRGLKDTSGRPYDPASRVDNAPVTLMLFGYTRCGEVCKGVLADLTTALRGLPADVRSRTRVVFVTVDPQRDTPRAIRAFLDRFDKAYVGIRGDSAKIARLAGAVGIAVGGRRTLRDGDYQVAHGAQVVAIGAGRSAPPRVQVLWEPDLPVGVIQHDIRTLVEAEHE